MKNVLAVSFYLLLLIFISCSHEEQKNLIDLNQLWKFKTGDDLSWAAKDFNDTTWNTIKPTDWWENQGYTNYDGYAWYRIKVLIPAST